MARQNTWLWVTVGAAAAGVWYFFSRKSSGIDSTIYLEGPYIMRSGNRYELTVSHDAATGQTWRTGALRANTVSNKSLCVKPFTSETATTLTYTLDTDKSLELPFEIEPGVVVEAIQQVEADANMQGCQVL